MSDIYIFYSHSGGVHDRGTSRIAWRDHGALWGEGRGRTGDAYGLVVRMDEDEVFVPDLHEQMRSLFEYANMHGGKYTMPVMTKEDESLYSVRDLCDAFLKNYSLLQSPDDFTSPSPEEWGFDPQKNSEALKWDRWVGEQQDRKAIPYSEYVRMYTEYPQKPGYLATPPEKPYLKMKLDWKLKK